MIAVGSNILVYAHRADSPWFGPLQQCLKQLAEGRATWAIPWPCIHEFLAIASHPKIYSPPSTISQAIDQVDAWMESLSLVIIGESQDYWSIPGGQLKDGQIRGPMVHDARIAAICIGNGVTRFLTADRDFSRFPDLRTHNPLIPSAN